jgi:endonuclease YncB( thermonuclease family)
MRTPVVGTLALVGVVAVAASAISDDASRDATRTRATIVRVVDGDTVVTTSGDHVRLIGMDTPERGTCGYDAATRALRALVEGQRVVLVDPANVDDRDVHGRLLRFVEVDGVDVGLGQVREGLATARYDSRDGYDAHPREVRYRQADRRTRGACQ